MSCCFPRKRRRLFLFTFFVYSVNSSYLVVCRFRSIQRIAPSYPPASSPTLMSPRSQCLAPFLPAIFLPTFSPFRCPPRSQRLGSHPSPSHSRSIRSSPISATASTTTTTTTILGPLRSASFPDHHISLLSSLPSSYPFLSLALDPLLDISVSISLGASSLARICPNGNRVPLDVRLPESAITISYVLAAFPCDALCFG